jgi:conjugative transfer pilus assembly protein TraH
MAYQTYKKFINFSMALFVIAFTQTSFADLQEEMDSMFGSYVNVTPGQIYETQRRGGFAAGSVFIRNKVSNPQLVNFEPPSFKAGCNGIDMFGGSFSFINKEQFINALRNIASNALGYAFELAISALCPNCAQQMDKLRNIVNQMNQGLLNSCQQGRALLNKSGVANMITDSMSGLRDSISRGMTNLGFATDNNASGMTGGDSEKSPVQIADESGQIEKQEINIIWDALSTANAAAWFSTTDTQMKEALMSVTGTIVLVKGTNAAGEVDLIPKPIDGTVKLMDIINANAGTKIKVLSCDTSDKCLSPVTTEIDVTKSLRQKVEDTIGDSSSGIMSKINEKSGTGVPTLTDSEKKFITAVPHPIYAQLKNLSQDKQAAQMYANYMIDAITAELSIAFYQELHRAVELALPYSNHEFAQNMSTKLAQQRTELAEMKQSAVNSMEMVGKGMYVYNAMRTAISTQQTSARYNVTGR